ncbi:MAG: helix-turn-helix domain-containing protein [Candidatus Micrarchaeota archaeon]
MKISDLFREIGFSEGEGKVYQAILTHLSPTLQSIHEETGIERRNVYDIVNKLISKGLVTYQMENRKKTYHTTHPSKILNYLEEREGEITNAKNMVNAELGQLVNMYEGSKEEFHTEIYRGNEGMKAVFEDILNYKHYYLIGGNFGVMRFLGEAFLNRWHAKREKKKIWIHDIIRYQSFIGEGAIPEFTKNLKYWEYKMLPKEFWSPHVIFIYGDKVVNVFWGEQSFAFLIQNEGIAKSYMDYFNYLWKTLPSPKRR